MRVLAFIALVSSGCWLGNDFDRFRRGDAGSLPLPDAGTNPVVDGEAIALAPGWSATLLVDFSHGTPYTYVNKDFVDGAETLDNAPKQVVALVAPFAEGIAVVFGRSVLELPTKGAAVDHAYAAATAGTDGHPDNPTDLFFAATTSTTPGRLLLSSSSTASGDGIYAIDAGWNTTVLKNSNNNNSCVLFDPGGVFDGVGLPRTYYSAYTSSGGPLQRIEDGATIIPSGPVGYVLDAEVLPGGNMAVVISSASDGSTAQLAEVESGDHGITATSTDTYDRARLVTGDVSRVTGGSMAVVAPASLIKTTGGTPIVFAQSMSPGWTWIAAAIPPTSHSLSAGGGTKYLLLESNRTLDLDRILLLTGP